MDNPGPMKSGELPAGEFQPDYAAPVDSLYALPPKPELEENKSGNNVWIKSVSSLALYFVIGYFFFNRDWILVLILTVVVLLHELGHFFAMKYYKYKDLGIFFIPLLGAYVSGTKQEVSQKQSAVILLAGPLPGIILGLLLFAYTGTVEEFSMLNEYLKRTASIFVFLNLLNLLPIYPLDGGQLFNRLFLDENVLIGRIFILISVAVLAYFAWFIAWPLLLFPILMLFRMFSDIQFDKLTKRIENEGVSLDTTYESMTDDEYWRIRNALIKHHPDLKDVQPAPPYEYSNKEDKVITTMQSLLMRTLFQDMSIAGKLIVMVLWLASFLVPYLMELPFPFRFGF